MLRRDWRKVLILFLVLRLRLPALCVSSYRINSTSAGAILFVGEPLLLRIALWYAALLASVRDWKFANFTSGIVISGSDYEFSVRFICVWFSFAIDEFLTLSSFMSFSEIRIFSDRARATFRLSTDGGDLCADCIVWESLSADSWCAVISVFVLVGANLFSSAAIRSDAAFSPPSLSSSSQ